MNRTNFKKWRKTDEKQYIILERKVMCVFVLNTFYRIWKEMNNWKNKISEEKWVKDEYKNVYKFRFIFGTPFSFVFLQFSYFSSYLFLFVRF